MTDLARDQVGDARQAGLSSASGLPWQRVTGRSAAIDPFDLASLFLLAALAVLVLATFRDYAITNDEWVQQRYGELIIAYYKSGLTDRAVFEFDNLYLYGGLFDVVAVLLGGVSALDPFDIRHLMSAMIGVAGIGAAIATARMIAGARAGLLAGASLAACGLWYGAMFHHTKDVPLGAAMAGALYFLIRAARDCPAPQLRFVVGFGVLTGAALGVRVLGLLLVCYIGVAVLFNVPSLAGRNWRQLTDRVARSLLGFVPALLIAYPIMIVTWPWAALAPLNPLRALLTFEMLDYDIRTLLAGKIYLMATVPRWYVPVYLTIKIPLLLLAGAALALGTLAVPRPTGWVRPDQAPRDTAIVAVAALFPVLCEVVIGGPAFCGPRHFLFVLPPLAILAGIGLDVVVRATTMRSAALGAMTFGLIAAGLSWNGATMYRLHPYQYLYYNELVGGLQGASRRYDTDYWFTMMPEAVDRLAAYIARTDPPGTTGRVYTVSLCGERDSFLRKAPANLRWAQDWETADFFIAPTHMNCDRDIDAKVAVTIERMGVPIGYVKDQRAKTRPTMAGP
ncbi:MAG: glycosyltransferase family 39 protein [Rhodopseudomonas sp.]|uniref:glycosyltransferase family 39 protein n=1 Tax=Rhodopseudomonas sp. TaxID=1078 RepID=UPI0017EA7835|nr:glycosyltransferase family 39 protein [Rhodopseudomonas sp.]NVN87258.1 glycosyltransferase family 39 protein [Rhodopseudomonas sp.]